MGVSVTEQGPREPIDVEALYRRYGPMILRRCRSLLGDEEQALDAMQDVFVAVLRRKDSLRPDYPSSLLYRIATNTCLNAIRSRKRRPGKGEGQAVDSLPGRDDPESRVLDACLLQQLFEAAKPGTRFLAETHYLRKATLAETAQVSGLSVSGVRKRLRKARGASTVETWASATVTAAIRQPLAGCIMRWFDGHRSAAGRS